MKRPDKDLENLEIYVLQENAAPTILVYIKQLEAEVSRLNAMLREARARIFKLASREETLP